MRYLVISGSPRSGGNTDTLLHTVLDELENHDIPTAFIHLRGRTINGCTACMGCMGANRCVQDDDFNPIYREMLNSPGFIVGSPVHFGSATPQTMALLDRAGYVSRRNGNLFARKVGGPVVVARRAGHNFTIAQLALWFMINGMIIPGSTYWTMAFGCDNADVLDDSEGVAAIRTFASNIAWLIKKLSD